MVTTFEKKQIVSSTELVRSFKKYENELPLGDIFIFKRNAPEAVLMDYSRYEKIKQKLEELEYDPDVGTPPASEFLLGRF